jgi:hypothetical protein
MKNIKKFNHFTENYSKRVKHNGEYNWDENDIIDYKGKKYKITDKIPEIGDMFVNLDVWKRGLYWISDVPKTIGTVMDIFSNKDGSERIFDTGETGMHIRSFCRKIEEV